MDRQQADLLTRQGIAALRQGDAAQARSCFAAVCDAPSPGEVPPWFLLAQACQALGDSPGQGRALIALLAADPRHLGGLPRDQG